MSILNDLQKLISAENGMKRRDIFSRLYFKICILESDPYMTDIAKYSGYSYKTVHDFIKGDKELIDLLNKKKHGKLLDIGLPTEKNMIKKLENQMMDRHIRKTKKSFNNYGRFSDEQKEEILNRIRSLYV